MKQKYEKPIASVFEFQKVDYLITTSGGQIDNETETDLEFDFFA